MRANDIHRTAIGNIELLQKQKIGFLASRKIATLSVLPTLDWATEISQREEVAVVSGFHSQMEKEVLKILLRGKCGIIILLARGMYRQVPKLYEEALRQNRLLLLSYEKDNVTRISEQTAHKRNKQVVSLSDEMKQL
ncbi:MAG: DNA-processing protein DprA [Parabacteroides sp.]